jgi:hypothetical protein
MLDEGQCINKELVFWDFAMFNICEKLDIVVNIVQFLNMVLFYVQYFG